MSSDTSPQSKGTTTVTQFSRTVEQKAQFVFISLIFKGSKELF